MVNHVTIDRVASYLRVSSENIASIVDQANQLVQASDDVGKCLKSGGKILLCGNGGSAADAQHIAAELVGRYTRDRAPLAAVALTTDTSALTAIANDTGYDQVFTRQVQALGRPGDVLIAISTSGNSPSVVEAVKAAKASGLTVIGLTGQGGGVLAEHVDQLLDVPSTVTSHVQEMHIVIGHILCGLLEDALT